MILSPYAFNITFKSYSAVVGAYYVFIRAFLAPIEVASRF